MKKQTFKAISKEGKVLETYYCKKEELVNLMTVKIWSQLNYIKIENKADDTTEHKPITKRQLEKYL